MTRRMFVKLACRASAAALAGWLAVFSPPNAFGQTTSSIGTMSRDYATISGWEAAIATANVIGECYDDAAFDEQVALDDTDATTQLRLSVASGERHDGTAGSGARIDRTTGQFNNITTVQNTASPEVEWLEWDGNDNATGFGVVGVAADDGCRIHHLIVHDISDTAGSIGINSASATTNCVIFRCFVYDIKETGTSTGTAWAIVINSADGGQIHACTILGVVNNGGTGSAEAVHVQDTSGEIYQNILALDPSGTTSGSTVCYSDSSIDTATSENNGASDTTASGTSPQDSLTSGDELVATAGGSEDLHLKAGATSLEAGKDLATTPSGVEVDIDGVDINASGAAWDIGAHNLTAPAATPGAFPMIGGGFVPGD